MGLIFVIILISNDFTDILHDNRASLIRLFAEGRNTEKVIFCELCSYFEF